MAAANACYDREAASQREYARRSAAMFAAAETHGRGEMDTDDIDPDLALSNVAAMLLGFALENALKGLIAARNAGVKELPVPRTHKLVALAKEAAYPLSSDEALVLDHLSWYLVWRGRYPMPVKWEDLKEGSDSRDLLRRRMSIGQVRVREVGSAVFERIEQYLTAVQNRGHSA